MNFHNEIEPHAAQWLRNLIGLGELPDGIVDERSIVDVSGDDLAGYDECHFFAGIGVWPRAIAEAELALGRRLARPLFTGSCPCQPLSVAGQRQGALDGRHLWPAFHRLIAERRPATILGEQVAGKDGREWMAAVRHDLEELGYACGCCVLPAGGFGAPHIRHRMFFVADAGHDVWATRPARSEHQSGASISERIGGEGAISGLADADDERPQGVWADGDALRRQGPDMGSPGLCGGAGDRGLADAAGRRREPRPGLAGMEAGEVQDDALPEPRLDGGDGWPSAPDSFWDAADWIFCRDGKWRPVKSSFQCLVDGTSPRLGRMRAEEEIDGNAGQGSAAAFLRSVREEIGEEAFFERIGRLLSLPEEEMLRSGLYGAGNGEGGLPKPQSQPIKGGEISQASVRGLRQDGPNARPSRRREPKKQRAIELEDVMSFLSQTAASPLIDGAAFKSGGPYEGMSRAGMLRGYGNAIVLPVAVAFVQAALEAIEAERD